MSDDRFVWDDASADALKRHWDRVCGRATPQEKQEALDTIIVAAGLWEPPLAPDPLALPLPTAAPATWPGREDRVAWVLAHLTPGEHAMLYRLLHDGHGLRRAACPTIEADERKELRR
jgi:hypothetical protein